MTQMTQPTLTLGHDDLHLVLEAIITRRQHLRSVIKSVDEADGDGDGYPVSDRCYAELGGLLLIQDRVLEALYPLTRV